MVEKREFELLLLRLVPHALRDDFMTVGVVVLEPGGEFADFRISRDWKRLECFAPDLEVAILEHLETAVRAQLKEIRGRDELLQLVETRFGAMFDVGPTKAMVAADPAAEMRLLERDYLSPFAAATRAVERARRMGRLGIAGQMQNAFAEAGVLEMLQRELNMEEFTGEHDPFRVDFGLRVGKSLKMFHALALNISREPAVTLAYRYSKIQSGMWARGEQALMTAVINEDAVRSRGEAASGVAMLRANEIVVRDVAEMGKIAEEVRRELRA